MSTCIVIFALYYCLRSPSITERFFFLCTLLAGGTLSNQVDHLLFNGYATDFIMIKLGSLRTGIFNLADMVIMVGGILLLIFIRSDYHKPKSIVRV
jgi:signal peptidase II